MWNPFRKKDELVPEPAAPAVFFCRTHEQGRGMLLTGAEPATLDGAVPVGPRNYPAGQCVGCARRGTQVSRDDVLAVHEELEGDWLGKLLGK